MSNSNPSIPEDIAAEVLKVASEIYAETQNTYSLSELQAAGKEVNIPPEIISEAIAKVKEQQRLAKEKQLLAQQRNKTLIYIGSAIAGLTLLWGIFTYNSLSNSAQKVDATWSQIENQLQRRTDLIPQLINVVEAQSTQEKEVIKLLEDSRNRYLSAQTQSDKLKASGEVTDALNRFRSYFGSSQAYINLQYEMAGTENRIATERKRYNEAVQAYNQKVKAFPNSLIAAISGFKPRDFYQKA
ncbi:LemA family protein [Gloeocapsa sp. PCC 73106]|uniref:LemA family protein n=1 Tax=Gloeocapsa sp. PCC 73106 TaxID=102232 RepID=UPI0002AC7493|nr:LemA family protein [Gloeocapsa sp. PCC 73106]ELR97785.1 hypothetical protein GLO73106DRAFT_00016020 [Gloeocapsa sp. PCC 73106]